MKYASLTFQLLALTLGWTANAAIPSKACNRLLMSRSRVVGVETRISSERNAILPEIGKSYDVSFFWEDRPIRFSVSFGESFVTWLREGGHHFDIKAGMILTKDAEKFAVGGNNELYEERTGRTAPPWLFYVADKNVFGLPRGRLFLELQDSAVTANYLALNIIDIIDLTIAPEQKYHVRTVWNGRVYEFDVEISHQMAVNLHANIMSIDLETGELVRNGQERYPLFPEAKKDYEQRTGKPAPPWLVKHKNGGFFGIPVGILRGEDFNLSNGHMSYKFDHGFIESDSFYQREPGLKLDQEKTPITDWHPHVEEYAPHLQIEAPSLTLITAARKIIDEVLGRAIAKQTKSGLSLKLDQEIVVAVVPLGKHWATMPHVLASDRVTYINSSFASANYVLGRTRYVFVLESELASSANSAWLSKHELYHALESNYFDDEQTEQLEQIYRATVRNNGPFARETGFSRTEFLTTFGELFEGRYGQDGLLWFQNAQPALYKLFVSATGRDPLNHQ